MENVAIKGRGGNDVQHKSWKGKILRINNIAPANFLREENAGFIDTPLGCHQSELSSFFAIAVFTTQYPTNITKLVI